MGINIPDSIIDKIEEEANVKGILQSDYESFFDSKVNAIFDEAENSVNITESMTDDEKDAEYQQFLDNYTYGPVQQAQKVTPRQMRLALFDQDLLSSVETEFDNLSEPLRSRAKIEWEYSSEIDINSKLIQNLYPKLGLTEQQLKDLFTAAAQIQETIP